MLVQGTAGDLIYWKSQKNKFLGIHFMEKAKLRYDWEFILLKMFKYHATGDLLKGLKYQIFGDLFHGKW